MTLTITASRDRGGHAGWPCNRRSCTAALLLLVGLIGAAAPASAQSRRYKAERFDSIVQVRPGGTLEVHETVVFAFQNGTFTRVWRDIPARRTDGIEVVSASMDGRDFSTGSGPDQITVSGSSRRRVEWHFSPVGTSTHTFELVYRARGVAYADEGTDLVAWQALPSEHAYVIDAVRVRVTSGVTPLSARADAQRRVRSANSRMIGADVEIEAFGIRQNGTFTARVRYPAGAIVSETPGWKVTEQQMWLLAPRWGAAAAGIFGAGLLLLLGLRARYPAPETPSIGRGSAIPDPPDDLPPGLAGALAFRGSAGSPQAMATLLDLADRGAITIRELPRTWGMHSFELTQVPGRHDLAEHEQAALLIAFDRRTDPVTLARASGRLGRRRRAFTAAVEADLASRGLLDESRRAARKAMMVTAFILLMVATLGMVGTAAIIPRYGPFPLLLGAAVFVLAFVALIMGALMTSLSDEGVLRGAQWNAFRRHLRDMTRDSTSPDTAPTRWTAYAMALNLGIYWSRYLKHHPAAVPPWFAAAAAGDPGAAWVAFVGSSAAATSAGAGGGGAAGGGGSGAG